MRTMHVLALVCLSATSSRAEDDVLVKRVHERPATSIALVDMAEVFKGMHAFTERADALKAEVTSTAAQMKTMQAMLTDLAGALEKATTDAERTRLEKDVLKIQAEMQSLKSSMQRSLAAREAVIYRECYAEVRTVVASIAHERGFTMVLRHEPDEIAENDEPRAVIQKLNRLVVFAEPHHDITEAVVERLNSKLRTRD